MYHLRNCILVVIGLIACDADRPVAGVADAVSLDATWVDASPLDAGPTDAAATDAAAMDAGPTDAGPADANPIDAATGDASPNPDADLPDAAMPDASRPDAELPAPARTCVADLGDEGAARFEVRAGRIDYDLAGAPGGQLRWGEAVLAELRPSGVLRDDQLAPRVGGVDGLARLMAAGLAAVHAERAPGSIRVAVIRCPRPDRPALRPWAGWDYRADADGDGVDERHVWDQPFHAPWVPDVAGALAIEWSADPEMNRANIVAAMRSGAARIHLRRPPDPARKWLFNNQIPVVKAFNINAVDGLEILIDEGIVIEADDQPYFHDNSSKLFSIDEMVGLRMAAVDSDGDGVIAPTIIRMRKDLYDPASPTHDPAYEPSESRHALRMFRSRDVLIQDLTFADSGGDGIYLGDAWINHPEVPEIHVVNQRVTLRRVVCANNFRQGMTVTGVWGLRVEDSVFRDTSGTPPAYGIDFEPNHAFAPTRDVVIRDSRFIDNARAGVGMAFGSFRSDIPVEVAMIDSTISGAAGGSDGVKIHNFDDGRVADIYLGGVIIEDVDYFGIFFSGKNGETARVTLEDTHLRRTARVPVWQRRNDAGDLVDIPTAPITFSKAYVARYIGGVRFIDSSIEDDQARPAIRVLPRADGSKATRDVTGRIFVHSPLGAAIDLDDGDDPNVNVDVEVVPLGR